MMKNWKCIVCGEIVASEGAPESCPKCKAPADQFAAEADDFFSDSVGMEEIDDVAESDSVDHIADTAAEYHTQCNIHKRMTAVFLYEQINYQAHRNYRKHHKHPTPIGEHRKRRSGVAGMVKAHKSFYERHRFIQLYILNYYIFA